MPVKKTETKTKKRTVSRKTTKLAAPVMVSRSGVSVDVYDVKGKVIGKISLPKEIFAAKVNPVLMAQAVRVYLANQRKGTASTKTRGEVTASTRKIYRQKGTGRARHGGISAPIFVGGGVVFGPKPRDYSLSLPKKMKKKALASALTNKVKDHAIKVVDGLEKLEPKTKIMNKTIMLVTESSPSASLRASGQKARRKVLLIIPEKIENVQRAARNIEGVTIRPANLLTTYEVLNNDMLLFMKESVKTLENVWTKQAS